MCCRIAGSVNIPLWTNDAITKQHRGGPDGCGHYTTWGTDYVSQIEIGHNRLSILDLSVDGDQPMRSKNGRYSITYNGEVYNFKELLPEAKSDTVAILHSMQFYGINATLERLTGMFAFGVFDEVEKKLHCVVDRIGEKPLYYFHEGNKFAFASSPAPLIKLKEKWNMNRKALESYWYLGSVFGEDTLFDGIKKLMPAHHLTYDITTNEITIERYWKPKFQEKTDDIQEHIISSIEAVKVADVPVNIFLSGGVDSTLVASRFAGYGAVHLESPEQVFARQAAERFGLKFIIAQSSKCDSLKALQDYSAECGEPTMAGLIPYLTSEQSVKHGKVAITANGADELFYGYNRTIESVEKQMRHIFRPGYEVMWTEMYLKWFKIDQELMDIGGTRWFELMSYVAFDLNKTLDFASMCHGLEVRSPFLNHKLVEKALSIPQKKHFSERFGAKTILKEMLSKLGFTDTFLTRAKQGFSLSNPPSDLEAQKNSAYQWAKKEGFCTLDESHFNGRDWQYTLSAAIGFKAFWDVHKDKFE